MIEAGYIVPYDTEALRPKLSNDPKERHVAPDAYRIRSLQALEDDCKIRLSKATGECELDKLIAQAECKVKLSEMEKSAARKKTEDSFNHHTAVAYSAPSSFG